MSDKKEATFKVDFALATVDTQITIRVGAQSVQVPAYRRDDDDFETVTCLKSITFDHLEGGIELRYISLKEG